MNTKNTINNIGAVAQRESARAVFVWDRGEAEDREVAGSSPAGPTTSIFLRIVVCLLVSCSLVLFGLGCI